MDEGSVHPDGVHRGVCRNRVGRHALVNEPRLAGLTSTASLGIAQSEFTLLIGTVRSGDHGASAHIGGNAFSVVATSAIAYSLALLSVPDVSVETTAISRRNTDSVIAKVSAVWQAAGGVLVVAISILANARRQIGTEAVLTTPEK